MSIIKLLAKKIIRGLLRIAIFFHRSDKYSGNSADSLALLKKVYPLKGYDLNNGLDHLEDHDFDLSLIVPVYNARDFLKECIDSLLEQKTGFDYEVICVDDGSTDDSLEILKSYHDERLKVVHQDNAGISAARNKGLSLSRGEYVGFVDNDDHVSRNYVEKLLSKAFDNDADYVKCSYQIHDGKKTVLNRRYPEAMLDNFDDVKDYRMWLEGYMWGGVYKREVFEGFCFPEGYWYEDMIRNLYLYDRCRVLCSIAEPLYFKRKHENNAADRLWKKKDLHCLDELYLPLEIVRIKEEKNISPGTLSRYALYLEMGEYLYKRTLGLDEDIRRAAFDAACDLFDFDIVVNRRKDYELYQIRKAFHNRDYRLYNLIGSYCRYR